MRTPCLGRISSTPSCLIPGYLVACDLRGHTLGKVASGKVSADGASVATDGQGLYGVSWVGYRPAP